MSAGENFSAWITSNPASAAGQRFRDLARFQHQLFLRRAASQARRDAVQSFAAEKGEMLGKHQYGLGQAKPVHLGPAGANRGDGEIFEAGRVFPRAGDGDVGRDRAGGLDDFARRRRHAGPDLDQGLRHFPAAQQRASLTLGAEKFLARRQGLAVLDQPFDRGAGHFENFRRFRRQSQHHRASRGKSHAAALRADAEQVGGEIAIGRVIEKQALQLREGNIRRHEIFDSVRWKPGPL